MSTHPKLDPSKTSWDYIKKANEKKIFITVPNKTKGVQKPPSWLRHSVGTKFRTGEDDTWYIRTEEGRKPLEEDDPLLNPPIPLYCPKCKKIMKRGDLDTKAYIHTGGCFVCHVNEKAKKNETPNIHEFKRKIKIIEEKINEDKKNGN